MDRRAKEPEGNAHIVGHFVVSLKTVRNQVSAVLAKFGVSTRAEAVVKARQAAATAPGRTGLAAMA